MYLADKKVAILSPTSVAGVVGGAERFYAGLLDSLRQEGCGVEMLNMPVDESSFDSIMAGYESFARLDLSRFDLVISTKAPTYVATHPNHLLYLVHTIRVFYDMFDEVFPWANDEMKRQRRRVHELDTTSLARIPHRFSIGHEVSRRLRQWNGLDAEVLHPPLATQGFRHGPAADYFFLPGRLHGWKRVDLVVRAVQHSRMPMRLLIAGTGDAERGLKDLAAGDPRIEFLGQISDAQMLDLYAGALAVPFVPLREDYGYITLEAFASGKPVITCTDSGEPLQFVVDGVTGLVCEPIAESLSTAMERMYVDRPAAAAMGMRGAQRIEDITWPKVAARLLRAGFGARALETSAAGRRAEHIKVTVVDMQPIEPAVGGGRLRLQGVYHALGQDIDARYVGTFDWPGEKFRQHRLSAGLEEIDIPLSDAHHAAARALSAHCGGKTVIDLAFPLQCHLSPDYIARVRSEMAWADVVVFTHPWVYPLVSADIRPDQIVVYDAHNVESLLRAQILDVCNPVERDLLRLVIETEYAVGRAASLIFTCSQQDLGLMHQLYGWRPERMVVVPNGAMANAIAPATAADRAHLRAELAIAGEQPVVFFIGSSYGPNIEAARFIIDLLAPALPAVLFVIGGGVGSGLAGASANVRLTGALDDAQRQNWLRVSDLAINPMFSGSGTNIKMFDFMAAGLPILSTETGARGITNIGGGGLRLAEREGFSAALESLLTQRAKFPALGGQNRAWMEQQFAWESISPLAGRAIRGLVSGQLHPVAAEPGALATRIAHVSTVGQLCGIGEYTARMLEAFTEAGISSYLVTCATPEVRPLIDTLPAPAEVGWMWDNETWCDSRLDGGIAARLQAWGAERVIIQYHPAFYSSALLATLAQDCLQRKLGVAILIHNLAGVELPVLGELIAAGCVVLSHSRREIAEAAAQGVELQLLPFLVPSSGTMPTRTIAGRDLRLTPPLIASTGFVRPHKGFPQLIEAFGIVRQQFPGARLLLQCSRYPTPDSDEELALCRALIERLGLAAAIDFDTVFRPIAEVHERLATADLAILPYGPSNEGGSASAATVLASGVPLVVSPSQVFHDVTAATDVLPDIEPGTIAATILGLLQSPAAYGALAQRGSAYVQAHSSPSVARRLLEILAVPLHATT